MPVTEWTCVSSQDTSWAPHFWKLISSLLKLLYTTELFIVPHFLNWKHIYLALSESDKNLSE